MSSVDHNVRIYGKSSVVLNKSPCACSRLSDDQADDNDAKDDTSAVAGTLRNLLRRMLKPFSKDRSNKLFTKRMLTKVISKSQIHDVSAHYSTIKNEAKNYYKHSGTKSSNGMRHGYLIKTVGFSAVNIGKSIVLGGAVFAIYEKCLHECHHYFQSKSVYEELMTHEYGLNVMYLSFISLFSGFFAGVTHGGLFCLLERIVNRLCSLYKIETSKKGSTYQRALPKLPSTMLSHGFVYATLFGVYDFMKQNTIFVFFNLRMNGLFKEVSHEVEGVASVITGAAFAGIASELVNSMTHSMESKKLHDIFCRKKSMPHFTTKHKFRSRNFIAGLIPTIGSTVVGFLAYEYASQVVSQYI